jgi:polar amino acid transport system ATP-binding protein/sulfate transport system ATP-binding protein/NitT/TauT family transport system ATP-binding protein
MVVPLYKNQSIMTTYIKTEELLRAENVHLYYDDQCILRNINFSIRDIVRPGLQQGQVVSLIGRSGIGKTQLFRLLSGLQNPSSGSIKIRQWANGSLKEVSVSHDGSGIVQPYREVRPGDMGVIFQNYYLFGWRTVYQSLLLAARKNGNLAGKEKETIRDYAERFDLSETLHFYPQQLSGGQQQRVSIIQQLLKGSNFLLLDEPFSGLDVCVLDKVVELLVQVSLSHELKTLIIVSHDIATAVAISDTVFILGKEAGKPGSTIVREIDLIERGLAWQKVVWKEQAFTDTIEEIKGYLYQNRTVPVP